MGRLPPLPLAPAEDGPVEEPATAEAEEGPADEEVDEDEGCGEKLARLTTTLKLWEGCEEDAAAAGASPYCKFAAAAGPPPPPPRLGAGSDPDEGSPSLATTAAAASDSGELSSSSAEASLELVERDRAPPELEAAQKSAELEPSSGRLEDGPPAPEWSRIPPATEPQTYELEGPGCGSPSSTWSSATGTAPCLPTPLPTPLPEAAEERPDDDDPG